MFRINQHDVSIFQCSECFIHNKMKVWILLVLFIGVKALLECRYMCDDPVVYATCSSQCNEPVCEFQNCTDCSRTPICRTVCPEDNQPQCTESCPACEIQCDEVQPCQCDPICEPPNCGWVGHQTVGIGQIYPRCELQCEKPACEFVDSPASRLSLWG